MVTNLTAKLTFGLMSVVVRALLQWDHSESGDIVDIIAHKFNIIFRMVDVNFGATSLPDCTQGAIGFGFINIYPSL